MTKEKVDKQKAMGYSPHVSCRWSGNQAVDRRASLAYDLVARRWPPCQPASLESFPRVLESAEQLCSLVRLSNSHSIRKTPWRNHGPTSVVTLVFLDSRRNSASMMVEMTRRSRGIDSDLKIATFTNSTTPSARQPNQGTNKLTLERLQGNTGAGTWLASPRAELTQTARYCGPPQSQGCEHPKPRLHGEKANDSALPGGASARRCWRPCSCQLRDKPSHSEHYGFPFLSLFMGVTAGKWPGRKPSFFLHGTCFCFLVFPFVLGFPSDGGLKTAVPLPSFLPPADQGAGPMEGLL